LLDVTASRGKLLAFAMAAAAAAFAHDDAETAGCRVNGARHHCRIALVPRADVADGGSVRDSVQKRAQLAADHAEHEWNALGGDRSQQGRATRQFDHAASTSFKVRRVKSYIRYTSLWALITSSVHGEPPS
jgi:hypothetical protein